MTAEWLPLFGKHDVPGETAPSPVAIQPVFYAFDFRQYAIHVLVINIVSLANSMAYGAILKAQYGFAQPGC